MDADANAVRGCGANITFTNTRDEDLDVLYAAIEHDEDDVDLAQANDELAGVDGEDKDDASNEDYDPEQSDGKDSKDKEDNDSNNNDDDGDDAPDTEILDDDVNVNKQTETIPGVDQKIPGVDGTEGKIPGVEDAKGTPEMDDTTTGVDDEVTPGVDTLGMDDDVPGTAKESYGDEIEPTNEERTSGAMKLCRQRRKEYNRKNYNNLFNITDETQEDSIMLM